MAVSRPGSYLFRVTGTVATGKQSVCIEKTDFLDYGIPNYYLTIVVGGRRVARKLRLWVLMAGECTICFHTACRIHQLRMGRQSW